MTSCSEQCVCTTAFGPGLGSTEFAPWQFSRVDPGAIRVDTHPVGLPCSADVSTSAVHLSLRQSIDSALVVGVQTTASRSSHPDCRCASRACPNGRYGEPSATAGCGRNEAVVDVRTLATRGSHTRRREPAVRIAATGAVTVISKEKTMRRPNLRPMSWASENEPTVVYCSSSFRA